jgi:hypothetical protein
MTPIFILIFAKPDDQEFLQGVSASVSIPIRVCDYLRITADLNLFKDDIPRVRRKTMIFRKQRAAGSSKNGFVFFRALGEAGTTEGSLSANAVMAQYCSRIHAILFDHLRK